MPHIDQDAREQIEAGPDPLTVGELNFAITRLCRRYFEPGPHDYTAVNEIVGALECAKQEWYRRIAVPLEDLKRAINGDVYPE